MNKFAALTTAGIGGSSVAVGGAYLTGWFGPRVDYELPKTLTDFTSNNVEDCVLSLFPNISDMSENTITPADESSNKVDSNLFKTTDSQEKLSGCLVVNWEQG